MRTYLLIAGLCVMLPGFAPAPIKVKDTKPDEAMLLGKWELTEWISDGMAVPEATRKQRNKVVFLRDAMTMSYEEVRVVEKISIKLDSRSKPKRIDLIAPAGPGKSVALPGIYELSGDTLTICFNQREGNRPNEFKSPKGSRASLLILKRVKP